jgi:Leucine-rich repeat (LRR) protein
MLKTTIFFIIFCAVFAMALNECPFQIGLKCQCLLHPNKTNIFTIECNEINFRKQSFPNLTVLKNLSFDLNWLTINNKYYNVLPNDAFKGLRLTRVDLTRNKLQLIEPNAFNKISYGFTALILEANKIVEINLESEYLQNLTYLSLYHNEVRTLKNDMFSKLKKLTYLNLGDNWITEINEQVFRDFTELKTLILNRNFIVKISNSVFKHLIKLKTLDLDRNCLEELNSVMFQGLQNLQTLYVAKNFIKFIEDTSFSIFINLNSEIDLDDQRLENFEVGSFYGLKKVKKLLLSNNQIKRLKSQTFIGLDNMETLDLQKNKIMDLEINTFKHLTNLKSLNLSHNKLYNLTSGVFNDLFVLTGLDLSSNLLTKLGSKFIPKSVKVLNLGSNNLNNIRSNYFDYLTNVETLNLASNQISAIEGKSFDSLLHLKRLYLTDNCLMRIDKKIFHNLKSLEYLHLDQNEFLNLDDGVFDNLTNLKYLNLKSNKISIIKENIFQRLVKLETLDLSSNFIQEISESNFKALSNIKILNLSKNQMNAFDLNNTLFNLSELHMTENSIEVFNLTKSFKNLIILDLNHNLKLKSIKYGLNAFKPSLQKLFLSNTNIDFFSLTKLVNDLTTLDLSHNFVDITVLEQINLEKLVDLYLMNTSFNYSIGQLDRCFNIKNVDLSFNNPRFNSIFMKNSIELRTIELKRTNISDFDLTFFNFSLFSKLYSLDLSWNNIRFMKQDYFIENKQLAYLNLSNNLIISVEPFLRSSEKYFWSLDLSFNFLRNLSELIQEDSHRPIYNIILNDNLIEQTNQVYCGNYFSNNFFHEVPTHLDSDIRNVFIELRNNSIQFVRNASFKYTAQSLRNLDLSMNKIEHIETEAFHFLNNLEAMNLSMNFLTYLDKKVLWPLYSLEKLNLSHNHLEYIGKEHFQMLTKLQILDIGHNRIKFIENDAFKSLEVLEYLNIYSNESDLRVNNQTLKGLYSVKEVYFSELLLRNASRNDLEDLKKVFKSKIYPGLESVREHYYSIYLTAIDLKYDDDGCRHILYFIRYNINLNLKSESQVLEFLVHCRVFSALLKR